MPLQMMFSVSSLGLFTRCGWSGDTFLLSGVPSENICCVLLCGALCGLNGQERDDNNLYLTVSVLIDSQRQKHNTPGQCSFYI